MRRFPWPPLVVATLALLAALGGGCARSEDVHRFGFRWLGRDVRAVVYLWDRTRTPTPRRVVADACDSVAAVLGPAPGSELARLAAAPPGTVTVSPLLDTALRLLLTPPLPDRPPLAVAPGWRHDPFRHAVTIRRAGATAPDPGPLLAGLAADLAVATLRETLGVSRTVLRIGAVSWYLGTAPDDRPWPVAVTVPADDRPGETDTLAVLHLVNRAAARTTVPACAAGPVVLLVTARRAVRAAQVAAALARLGPDSLAGYLATHLPGTGVVLARRDPAVPGGWRLLVSPGLERHLRMRRQGVPVAGFGGGSAPFPSTGSNPGRKTH